MAKILLVEDDNNLREIYEARLQAEGYAIVSAQDGEEALVIAKQEKPDLIISDVMMPKISGFEMLDILRNTDGLKDVKIIMLTALGQAEDKTRADALGANKYLVKSQVTLEDIVKTAHQLLDDDTTAPAPPVTADEPPATPTVAAPVLDPQTATPTIPVAIAPIEPTDDPSPVLATVVTPEPSSTPAVVNPEPVTPLPATADSVAPITDRQTDASAAATPTITAAQSDARSAGAETTAEEQADMQASINKFIDQPANSAPAAEVEAAPQPAKVLEPVSPQSTEVAAASANSENAANDQQLVSSAVDSLVADTVTQQKPSDVTAVEVPSTDTAPVSSAPSVPESSDGVTIAHKKVIQPINDPNNKTDLNALLAKEAAATTVTNPAPAAAVTTEPTAEVTPPTATTPSPSSEPPKGTIDPSSIAL